MRIEIIRDDQSPEIIEYSGKRAIVGRGSDADISIKSKGISRNHMLLEFNGPRIFAVDLESTNGTFIENQQLVPHEKVPAPMNKTIRLGKSVYLKLLGHFSETENMLPKDDNQGFVIPEIPDPTMTPPEESEEEVFSGAPKIPEPKDRKAQTTLNQDNPFAGKPFDHPSSSLGGPEAPSSPYERKHKDDQQKQEEAIKMAMLNMKTHAADTPYDPKQGQRRLFRNIIVFLLILAGAIFFTMKNLPHKNKGKMLLKTEVALLNLADAKVFLSHQKCREKSALESRLCKTYPLRYPHEGVIASKTRIVIILDQTRQILKQMAIYDEQIAQKRIRYIGASALFNEQRQKILRELFSKGNEIILIQTVTMDQKPFIYGMMTTSPDQLFQINHRFATKVIDETLQTNTNDKYQRYVAQRVSGHQNQFAKIQDAIIYSVEGDRLINQYKREAEEESINNQEAAPVEEENETAPAPENNASQNTETPQEEAIPEDQFASPKGETPTQQGSVKLPENF